MNKIKLMMILVILCNSPTYSTVSSQDQSIYLALNTDREIYSPGDTVYFFITGNNNTINETGKVNLYHRGNLFRTLDFNLTTGSDRVFWITEIYATNATYTAIAYLDKTPITDFNTTIRFHIRRDDLPADVYRFLEVNTSIFYKGNQKEYFFATITNIYTNESLEFEDNEDVFFLNLDNEEEDLIKFKPGHAIEIRVKTNDGLYAGSIIFAAMQGINQISIDLYKLPNDKQVLSILFPVFLCLIMTYYILRARKNFQKAKYAREDEIDNFKIEDL